MGVIFSLVHAPLPQPDYHNIRHHDAPGELCAHHDHLLRWHPRARASEDVAVLHWHWFVPSSEPAPLSDSGDGPAWHAHIADWDASLWGTDPPRLAAPVARLIDPPTPSPIETPAYVHVGMLAPSLAFDPPLAFSATYARRVSLASLLQRWAC